VVPPGTGGAGLGVGGFRVLIGWQAERGGCRRAGQKRGRDGEDCMSIWPKLQVLLPAPVDRLRSARPSGPQNETIGIHFQVIHMSKIRLALVAAALVGVAGVAVAQFPIMDAVANKVIQKYESSTCEQLWQNRGKPAGPEEERALNLLRNDPQMRQAFFNKIAGPVMNKMFECGMIP
jgi:hypothetical protein